MILTWKWKVFRRISAAPHAKGDRYKEAKEIFRDHWKLLQLTFQMQNEADETISQPHSLLVFWSLSFCLRGEESSKEVNQETCNMHKNRNEIKEGKGRSDAMIKATINNRNALFDVGIWAGTSGLKARNISCLSRSPESFLLPFRAFEIYSETLTRRIVKEPFLRPKMQKNVKPEMQR